MSKSFIHDSFFKEVFSHLKYALDLFRLILTKEEFVLFDWTTLKSSATTFIDKKGREKRTDLQFSVQMKKAQERFQLLFLVEHKSYQDSKAGLQLLGYQTGIYEEMANHPAFKPAVGLTPILPVLVYQGKDREWKGPLEFQGCLNWTKELKDKFGDNVMNFRPRFLNIPSLDLKKEAEGLTSYLVLFMLKHIWRLDEAKVREFFVLSRDMNVEDRKFLVGKVASYIQGYDPYFTWDILQDMEEEIIKEARVMSLLQYTLDKERKKSRIEGRQEGMQKGIEKGMQAVALNMLKEKADLSFICKVTGLSEEEINRLKNNST